MRPHHSALACITATAALLAGCGKAEAPQPPPPIISTQASPSSPMPSYTEPTDLPSVDNQEVDYTDPTSVAENYLLMVSTFLPGGQYDPNKNAERANKLATKKLIDDTHATLNPDVVHTGAWYTDGTTADDPVQQVVGDVTLDRRPAAALPNDTAAERIFQVKQTPITQGKRKLKPRTSQVTVTTVKNGDKWLCDQVQWVQL